MDRETEIRALLDMGASMVCRADVEWLMMRLAILKRDVAVYRLAKIEALQEFKELESTSHRAHEVLASTEQVDDQRRVALEAATARAEQAERDRDHLIEAIKGALKTLGEIQVYWDGRPYTLTMGKLKTALETKPEAPCRKCPHTLRQHAPDFGCFGDCTCNGWEP